jgi:peptidoglycan/LPS O-acetylase OafA/YrhL
MSRFFTAVFGIIAGFVLAHVINQTPEGREFFARARATLRSFLDGFNQTFRP